MTTTTPVDRDVAVTLARVSKSNEYAVTFDHKLDNCERTLFGEDGLNTGLHAAEYGSAVLVDVYKTANQLRRAGWPVRVTTANKLLLEADTIHLAVCRRAGGCDSPAHYNDAASTLHALWHEREQQFDPYATRIGTRSVTTNGDVVRAAQNSLSIRVIDSNTRTPEGTLHNTHRIIVNAADDALDIHDDIVEAHLADAFGNLRVDSDGRMWGDAADLHTAHENLSVDGWAVRVTDR
ncbi:hypothetical protein ACFQ9V_05610 [Leifsonia sp. NPDC056665]|uniref:hypothetical protein n=1 Tax=Leifsonia sp. NPDC056665 TaxID=3345901 RepID=UPI0036CD496E